MSYSKFESKCAVNWKSAYAQLDFQYHRHHERFKKFVDSFKRPLVCQECGGSGGEIIPVTDDGRGPFEACGFCEGTGKTTPFIRGVWLRIKRQEKFKANHRQVHGKPNY